MMKQSLWKIPHNCLIVMLMVVDTELDKDRLKGKMRDLLTEAQASEIA